MMRLFLLLLLMKPAAGFLFAQINNNITGRFDSVFLKQAKPDQPGCACAIVSKGKVIYEKGYGLADLLHKKPVTSETIMGVGSVSKQFTGYALLMLEKQGKLSLDDPVTKYFDLPYLEDTIRIYNLLTHTSGFHESNNFFDILYSDPQRQRTMERIEEFVYNHRRLEFEPGTKYSYNNSGYSLAAFIVEKVSGKPFSEFLQDNIFQPLGMDHSAVITDHTRSVKNLAVPYRMRGNSNYFIDSLKHDFYGFTGVFTSVSDLIKWDAHLSVLENNGDPIFSKLTTERYLKNGNSIHYGYGLEISNYRGYKTISHSGRDNGYTAYYLRIPEKKLSIFTICNKRFAAPWDDCYRLADVLIEPQIRIENPVEKSENVPAVIGLKDLNKYTGIFWSPDKTNDQDAVVKLERYGDILYYSFRGRERRMMPISAKVFFLENSPEKWSFAINNDHVDKIGASVDGIHTATYYHVDSFCNDPETLSIQGDYISDEMGIQVKIVYENDEWVLYHPEIGRIILIPLFKKGFNSRIGLIVWEGENTDQFRLLYDDISRLYFHRID